MIDTVDISKYKWVTKSSNKHICDYKFSERIGSESSNGEVFIFLGKTSVNKELVIKILPYENIDEVKYSIDVSNLVLNKLSSHFLEIYEYGICKDTIFSDNSKIKYRTVMMILNKINNKDINNLFHLIYENCGFECLKKIFFEYFDDELNLPTRYIITKRCYSDLQQYYKNYKINIKTWKIIICQILNGINDLQKYLKLVHNDLKFENILIDIKNDIINIILNDFGDSFTADINIDNWRKIDVENIFNIILLKRNIPSDIRIIIRKSLDFLSEYNDIDIIIKLITFFEPDP